MDDPQLPPELKRLERALAQRPCPSPSSDFRARLLGKVQVDLEQVEPPGVGSAPRRPNGWWAFAAATAATVLFWFNLSLSAAGTTAYGLPSGPKEAPIELAARQIRELLPELSEREATSHAVRLHAGSRLVQLPSLSASRRPGQPPYDPKSILIEGE